MSCTSPGIQECTSISIIEPDSVSLVETVGGALGDPAIQERGEQPLIQNSVFATVLFKTPKLNSNYRFEYLYVDRFNTTGQDENPGAISCVPVVQNTLGFVAELTGPPLDDGYILRWHVVVVSSTSTVQLDAPENLYLNLPWIDPHRDPPPVPSVFDIFFANPRSSLVYGFSELRVENLIDDPLTQTPLLVQVCQKRLDGFKITMNPVPPSGNYWLSVRTP